MMRKTIILVIGILCVFGFTHFPAFAESGHGHGSKITSHSLNELNPNVSLPNYYLKEVYTTLDPETGLAEKFFFPGETIYFVGEIFLSTPGLFDAFTIITDSGGKVVQLDVWSYNATTSSWYFYYYTNALPSGNYHVNLLISVGGGLLLTPVGFQFVIL
jgi:hypothetical protein